MINVTQKKKIKKFMRFFIGDDATKVQWFQLDRDHNLHGSHESLIRLVIKKHGAYEYWHDK